MAIYKNKTFNRWARKQELDDLSLCAAVNEMKAGLIDADLGSGLHDLDKESAAAFARWLSQTKMTNGFLSMASRKTSAATLTKTKKQA